jgi:hypothetical protein
MPPDKNSFFLNQIEPNKSCLLALREIILQHNTAIAETVKYGMPCFCFGKKALWYLWTHKKTYEPYILFVNGNELHHHELEQGNRSKMKILRIDATQDIPIDLIRSLLAESIRLLSK